jgi:ElaB/YqjD/DUF883 family membrane-anchored ribosome-binding protein
MAKVKKSSEKFTSSKNSWEDALEDAKERLERTKTQAAKIRNAIRIFENNLRQGVPWPGTTQTDATRN